LAFYDFFRGECGLQCTNTLQGLWDVAGTCGWWWPFENACIITPKPSAIRKNDNGLHCDGGPALSYTDAWHLWCLNGVRVPQWLAETTAEQLDPKKVVELTNAEVRREFVRKVGMERLWYKLQPTVIDEEAFDVGGQYQLADINVGSDRAWRYLRMENPSLPGTWHVEGVPQECRTVREALNFRNGLTEDQISDDGADWYQQGDVVLRPQGPKQFKRFPTVLT